MTEDLAYHLRHATAGLEQVQRDIQKLKAADKEKAVQLKQQSLVNTALWQLCERFAPEGSDLKGEVSKILKHLELMHAIGETHRMSIVRPLAREEEIEIWTKIATEATDKIQRLKSSSSTKDEAV